jgi:hypothetical protein
MKILLEVAPVVLVLVDGVHALVILNALHTEGNGAQTTVGTDISWVAIAQRVVVTGGGFVSRLK